LNCALGFVRINIFLNAEQETCTYLQVLHPRVKRLAHNFALECPKDYFLRMRQLRYIIETINLKIIPCRMRGEVGDDLFVLGGLLLRATDSLIECDADFGARLSGNSKLNPRAINAV
jgi:hypothetical protein